MSISIPPEIGVSSRRIGSTGTFLRRAFSISSSTLVERRDACEQRSTTAAAVSSAALISSFQFIPGTIF